MPAHRPGPLLLRRLPLPLPGSAYRTAHGIPVCNALSHRGACSAQPPLPSSPQPFGSRPPSRNNTLPAGKAIKLIGKFGAQVTRNFGGADSDTASSKSGAGAGSGNLGARALLGAQRRGTASRRGAVWWLGSGYVWAAHSACLSGGSQGSRSSFAQ